MSRLRLRKSLRSRRRLLRTFFMPGRVRNYNAQQASYISGQIRANGSFSWEPPSASTP